MRVFERKKKIKIRSSGSDMHPFSFHCRFASFSPLSLSVKDRVSPRNTEKRGNRWSATNEKFQEKGEKKGENVRMWRKDNILGWAITLAVGVSISSSSSRKGNWMVAGHLWQRLESSSLLFRELDLPAGYEEEGEASKWKIWRPYGGRGREREACHSRFHD